MFGGGIPSWLSGLTGAAKFANNPLNGNRATLGDAFQGIGHSMMNHYRNGDGGNGPQAPTPISEILKGLGGPPPGLTPPQAPLAPMAGPQAPIPSGLAKPGLPGGGWTPTFDPSTAQAPPALTIEALLRKFPGAMGGPQAPMAGGGVW